MRFTNKKLSEKKFQSVKLSKPEKKLIKGGTNTDYVIIEEIVIA